MPVMAEQPLTPIEVESIPFDGSALLNTVPVSDEIDMSHEVEHIAHGEKKAGLPQFNVTTFASQLFWLAIMFVVLYIYFAKSALPKLSSTIENRRETIKADLSQAEKISSDVEKTRDDYENAMSKAHDDARMTITQIEQHLRDESAIQSKDFIAKSDAAIADLERQAETEKERIKSDLNDIATQITSDIITKLTSLSVNDKDIENAIKSHTNSAFPSTNKKAA